MAQTALTPIFVGLRTALHILVAALVAVVIVAAAAGPARTAVPIISVAVLLVATYAAGGLVARRRSPHAPGGSGGPRVGAGTGAGTGSGSGSGSWSVSGSGSGRAAIAWLLLLTVEWLGLVLLAPEGAYLVFPLFFLFLHVLPRPAAIAAVAGATALAIAAIAAHNGLAPGGIIGPIIGAGVAVVIGLGYQSLAREATEREALLAELISTRDLLAASEREAGALAERARLARDIHDTLAQGLASIQMLLHAAERADPRPDDERPGIEHVRLARETAATNLADARRFVRELSPAALVDQGIGAALRRLAVTQWSHDGLRVRVRVADELRLPMPVQAALLRLAQGAMANVLQHAGATTADISIERDEDTVRLRVSDDGAGFDPDDSAAPGPASDSFGLTASRERVEQLGGSFAVTSAPGAGTTVDVVLHIEEDA